MKGREGDSRPYFCPECPREFGGPAELGYHLERHRSLGCIKYNLRGRVISKPCPKKCGRLATPAEMREHLPNCDGSLPLEMRRGAG